MSRILRHIISQVRDFLKLHQITNLLLVLTMHVLISEANTVCFVNYNTFNAIRQLTHVAILYPCKIIHLNSGIK